MPKNKKEKKKEKKNKVPKAPAQTVAAVSWEVTYAKYYQELMDLDLSRPDWLEQDEVKKKITFILDHVQKTDLLELEYKFTEAVEGFVTQCETLYSPILSKNMLLQERAKRTIVSYFSRGNFQTGKSREISFLPLELRLYIYVEILKRDADKHAAASVLDRIMVTLNKMEETDAYENSRFMTSWAEFLLFQTTHYEAGYSVLNYDFYQNDRRLSTLLGCTSKSGEFILQDRKKTLKSVLIDGVEKLDQEFWYGLNAFSDEKIFRDIRAAELCVQLFCDYFEKIFLIASEFRDLAVNYYRTGNRSKVASFLKERMLDEVSMKNYRRIKVLDANTLEVLKTDVIEWREPEDDFSAQRTEGRYEEYLYLWRKDYQETTLFSSKELPEKIGPKEYSQLAEKLLAGINDSKNIYFPNLEEYIGTFTTAMLNAEDWDPYILNFMVTNLHNLLRFMQHVSDVIAEAEKNKFEASKIEATKKALYSSMVPGYLFSKLEDITYEGFGAPKFLHIAETDAFCMKVDDFKTPFPLNIAPICMRPTSPSDTYPAVAVTSEGFRSQFPSLEAMMDVILTQQFTVSYGSWRLYEKTLPEALAAKRRAGWERIRQHHLSTGYHLPRVDILANIQERLDAAKNVMDSGGDARSALDGVLYLYMKYVAARDYDVRYMGDLMQFLRNLKKKGYRYDGKLMRATQMKIKDTEEYYAYLCELMTEKA